MKPHLAMRPSPDLYTAPVCGNRPIPASESSFLAPNGGTARDYTQPLFESLTGGDLESIWSERIGDCVNASDGEAFAARHFIGTVRDRVIEGLHDTEDYAEFQTATLLAFTRLKAFWFELNSRIGFQFASENPDNTVLLRAGLVAALLEAMEPHLPTRSIEKVNAFLSAVVSDDVDREGEGGATGSKLLPGPSEVRQKIMNLLNTIESLSERVVQQESELIQLRTGSESLQKEFGAGASASQIASRMRTLSASVEGLEAQARMEEIYSEVLGQALGTTDPLEVVREVRALRETARQREEELYRIQRENERVNARFGDALSSASALDRLRDAERFTQSARNEAELLQTRLAAQADAANKVMEERDRLLALIGAETMADAEKAIRALNENAEAYAGIASLLGDMGKELGKIPA